MDYLHKVSREVRGLALLCTVTGLYKGEIEAAIKRVAQLLRLKQQGSIRYRCKTVATQLSKVSPK